MPKFVKPARRLAIIASMAALVLAGAVTAPAAAEVALGATFVDGSDLVVKLAAGETFSVTLDVINGSAAPATFTVSFLDLQGPTGGAVPITPAPSATGVLAVSPATAPADIWKQSVTLTSDGALGVYTGEFVVTGSDGSFDRRNLNLTVVPAPAPFAVSQGFNEPMPSITLSVERSSWIGNESKPAPDVFFPVDPAIAPRMLPGSLINENGERAELSIGNNNYVTITANGPGAYQGVLGRESVGAESGRVTLATITLNVRDDWWATLVLLILALVAGAALEWFATDAVPKASLRLRLSQLRDAAEKATAAHEAWIESFRHWPGPAGSPRITGEGGNGRDPSGVITEITPYLTDAAGRAITDFNALGTLDARTKRWAADGAEYQKLVAGEEAFEALLRARQDLATNWRAFVTEMAEAQAHRDGRPTLDELAQGSDTRRAVREALTAEIIAFPAELERRRKLVEDAIATVGTLRDLGDSLRTIHYWMPDTSTHKLALDTLWTNLAAMPNPATDVEILRKAARELLEQVIKERRKLRTVDDDSSAEAARLGAIEIAGRRTPTEVPAVASVVETPRDARRRQWVINAAFGILILGVALVSGLATQYYGKPTFGSTSDYLGVVMWGFGGVAVGGLLKNLGSLGNLLGRAGGAR